MKQIEVRFLRYRVRHNFLSFWAIFCSFTPQTTWKTKIKKKCMEISSFYTCVPQMTIIWCMFPEIWSVADIILYCFGLFFALLPLNSPKNQNLKKKKKWKKASGGIIILHKCTKNYDHMLYCSLVMMYDGCNCYFLFRAIFSHFISLTSLKIKIWRKGKKTCGDIIILLLWTTNNNHMMYGSWDMEHSRIFCYFGLFFPFYLSNSTKNQKF